jgi:hypothetical protein
MNWNRGIRYRDIGYRGIRASNLSLIPYTFIPKLISRIIFFAIFALMVNGSAMAQTQEENLNFGDQAFADGDYYSASIYFYAVLTEDTSNISIAYKYAESCRLFNDYKTSEKWYTIVNNSSKSKNYPLALFYIAMMNKNNGKYAEALKNFTAYYEAHKTEDTYFTKKAFHEEEACLFAQKLMQDTVPVAIEHLSENVNTPYSEFGAQQLDDTMLVYSALRPNSTEDYDFILPNFYLAKIYQSKTTIAGWSLGKKMNVQINNKGTNNANSEYNTDHKKIYFTRCNPEKIVDMKCDIYMTEFKGGKWLKPVKLNDKINLSAYTSTQPALQVLDDKGDEVLYFVSDRPGGFGKNDIWYSLIKDGKYNDPVNLGSIINTPGDELSPYYRDSTGTLYFSSDWHDGLGGYDIFKSKGALNDWKPPLNLGYPVNTSYNDMYFTVNENDSDGYFTSNRPGSFYIKGETCCNDIWSYEWLKGAKTKVDSVVQRTDTISYEQNILDLLPLTLYFHNDIPDPGSIDTVTKLNYKTTLAEYVEMKGQYEKEYSKGLKGADKTKAVKDIDEFFDNYATNGFSKLQLFSEWLLKELQKGKDIKITVKGYCSPLHTTAYNIKLAKRRISSLINYFKAYEYGVLVNYMNGTSPDGGKLEIHEDPVGKSQANPLVSDNPNDERNSIYSRGAALERKIQIIMYQSNDTLGAALKYPDISFTVKSHDLGKVTQGDKKVYSFVFKNSGKANLIIAGVESSCGCIITDFQKDPILPGATGQINILYDSKDELGLKSETILVYANTVKTKTELTLTAEVVPAPVKKKEEPKKVEPKKTVPQKKK